MSEVEDKITTGAAGEAPAAPTTVAGGAPAPAAIPTTPAPAKAAPAPMAGDEGAEIRLTSAELSRRLERAKESVFRKAGVETSEQLEEKLRKVSEFEAKQEEQRRASLAEADRLREDLQRERTGRERAEARVSALKEGTVIRKEAARIARIGAKHIDPQMIGYAVPKFVEHLAELSASEVRSMGDTHIEKFFADFAKKNPRFARAKSNTPIGKAPAAPRVPAQSGTTPGASRGAPPAGSAPRRTAAPGPNEMSKADIAKEHGVTW